MKEKYKFLLALKLLEFEIKELAFHSKECCECFELLKNKLDYLCQFMTSDENVKQWSLWGDHKEIMEHSEMLRETSIKALCDIEKYQSICTYNHELDISNYFTNLSESVKGELERFCINNKSKVLFVGSGAFPISALIIAKEIGAKVMCLDIDMEAVNLGKKVANISGLESIVTFTNKSLHELAFSKEATHVIIASLVKNKLEVLKELKETINTSAKVILRYGNGLKSIFNYPLEKKLPDEWVQTKVSLNASIYDTVILEKSKVLA